MSADAEMSTSNLDDEPKRIYKAVRMRSRRPGGESRIGLSKGLLVEGVWYCDCDPRIPAVCGVVRKNGVNKGRRFYNCADQACSSFFWDDERETMEQAQSGATQGENSVEQANNREPIPWRRYGMVWLCSCGHYGYDEFTEQGANGMFELTTKLEQNGIEVLLMRRLENRHLLERLGTFVARIIIFAINTNFLAFLASQLLLARGTQAPPDLSNSQHTSSGQDPAPDGQRANAMPGSSYRSPGFYDNQTSNDGVSSQTSVPRNAPALTSSNQNFIVLCSNDSRWLTTREDLNVASIRSNNELFQAFRLCLRRRGNWARRMLSLQSVQRVTFVKFALRSDHEVDSIQPDHIPPPKEKHYDFQERDPGIVPPIGNKYLMHRLSDPKHCKDSTFCLTQIPKRIDSPPRYGMTPDHFTAWGLYFQEGMDLELLCWWGLLAFSFSLIFGITWAIVKHSVQDGFVIASYILAFETIALGTAQVAVGLNMK